MPLRHRGGLIQVTEPGNSSSTPYESESALPRFSPRLPAQWENQAAVWVAWPTKSSAEPAGHALAEESHLRLIDLLVRSIDVKVLVGDDQRQRAAHLLGDALADAGRAELIVCESSGSLIRDYGPTFVDDTSVGQVAAVAWGTAGTDAEPTPGPLGGYGPSSESASRAIARSLRVPLLAGGLTLAGGALETDGRGRLIATPQSVVSNDRNPGQTKEEIAQQLHQLLGVTEIVWLDGGGVGTGRAGNQVSQLARFVDAQNVVVAVCESETDPNFENLESSYRQLKLWGSATKPHINVHRLPIPMRSSARDLATRQSYCEFLMLGPGRLLLPTFGHPPTDVSAAELLAGLLPAAQVIPVNRDLVHSVVLGQPVVSMQVSG